LLLLLLLLLGLLLLSPLLVLANFFVVDMLPAVALDCIGAGVVRGRGLVVVVVVAIGGGGGGGIGRLCGDDEGEEIAILGVLQKQLLITNF
jgi:hypothetical protein